MSVAKAKCTYAQVYNFPRKVQNLRAKIEAMRDEAQALGFAAEASQLSAMAVFASCWIEPDGPQRIRGWTGIQDEQLKRLWNDGLTAAQIAPQVLKSRAAVCARARTLGLPSRAAGRKSHSYQQT